MANGYFPLPAYRVGSGINFEPVTNALTDLTNTRFKREQMDQQQKNALMEQQRWEASNARAESQHGMQAEQHRNALMDRQWQQPLERQKAEMGLKLTQAQIDATRAQAAQRQASASGSPDRAAKLQELGIDPTSAEGKAYQLTGKLPVAAYQNLAQIQRKQQTAPLISSGLQNLNKMADDYDDASFSNAVGPFQGSTPDGLFSALPINAARLAGEVSNAYEGGKSAPSEVRNNIVGATETLAAAIKPLIRAPGEGVWTDQDQARLVAIVGDLAQARDKPEYRRRLNAVRDRIRSNFGIELDFDALAGQSEPPAGPAQGAAAAAKGGWSITRVK
jgi:hypothetical protein